MSLDKVFKNHSLEGLHYQLKHPKKIKFKIICINKISLFYLLKISAEKFNVLPNIYSKIKGSRNENLGK